MSVRGTAWRAAVALLATIAAAGVCHAQGGSHLADPAAAVPSRWSADLARIDDALRSRSLVVVDARGNWVAGHFDVTDPAAQVAHFATARFTAPAEPLYIASLAIACQQRVEPTLPACDSVDRLADWATRDVDNGVPTLMLAAKAARRGDSDATAGYLAEAAAKPRFDDYVPAGWLAYWTYVTALPLEADGAAKAEAAIDYAAAQPQLALAALPAACAGTEIASARRAVCARAGEALAERGTTFYVRALGASVAERNAVDAAAAARARQQRAALEVGRAQCSAQMQQWRSDLDAPDAAVRTRAVAALDGRVRDVAAAGEVAACRRGAAAAPTRP